MVETTLKSILTHPQFLLVWGLGTPVSDEGDVHDGDGAPQRHRFVPACRAFVAGLTS